MSLVKRNLVMAGVVIASATFMSSCKHYQSATNKVLPVVVNEVITVPKMMDFEIDFDNKIVGEANGRVAGRFSSKKYLTDQYYIERAYADAIRKGGYDFIVEPIIDMDIQRKRISVIVTGYGAKYSGLINIDIKNPQETSNFLRIIHSNSGDALERSSKDGYDKVKRGSKYSKEKGSNAQD